MNKIPTAEEYLIGKGMRGLAGHTVLKDYMIEFAKLHVKAALEAAYINSEIVNNPKYFNDINFVVDSDSILNAYPDELIK